MLAHFAEIGTKIQIISSEAKGSIYILKTVTSYCKSTNFGVLLYLANCVCSLIFVAASIYVDRTLHRQGAGRRQITFLRTQNFIAAKIS